MNTHISKVCSKAFRIYNTRQIRKYLSTDSAKCLIHAFVISHLDYCNSLLYKLPQYQSLSTFAPIATAHPYSARKFTCHVMHRARALSTKMNNDREDVHCYSFAWI